MSRTGQSMRSFIIPIEKEKKERKSPWNSFHNFSPFFIQRTTFRLTFLLLCFPFDLTSSLLCVLLLAACQIHFQFECVYLKLSFVRSSLFFRIDKGKPTKVCSNCPAFLLTFFLDVACHDDFPSTSSL